LTRKLIEFLNNVTEICERWKLIVQQFYLTISISHQEHNYTRTVMLYPFHSHLCEGMKIYFSYMETYKSSFRYYGPIQTPGGYSSNKLAFVQCRVKLSVLWFFRRFLKYTRCFTIYVTHLNKCYHNVRQSIKETLIP
jgi:hypothetical protein